MFLPHESFWIVLFLKHLFNLQFIERGSLGNYGSGDSCFYNPGDRMEASGKLSIDRQIIEKDLLRGRVHSGTQWVVSARRVLSAEEGAAGCWGAALPSLCLEHLCLGWAIPTLLAAWLFPAWLLWRSQPGYSRPDCSGWAVGLGPGARALSLVEWWHRDLSCFSKAHVSDCFYFCVCPVPLPIFPLGP